MQNVICLIQIFKEKNSPNFHYISSKKKKIDYSLAEIIAIIIILKDAK